jgi:hypothetical protein
MRLGNLEQLAMDELVVDQALHGLTILGCTLIYTPWGNGSNATVAIS